MSGGSQHNPNGRQSQLGSGWSPLQLQVANLLARAPQAHMASDRGVTWHTPTPPPHLYHVPAPSPPDPLQALKAAGPNSVFRHTATPPELYRHTPTPPDKHMMRHTPSPGDIKASAALPPVDMYPLLPTSRDKMVRPEELLSSYARVGVDLSLGGRAANGAATSPAPPALSVRDAPTINSLIARAQPRPPHARVDALLERLAPAPSSPHSVIVHPRAAPSPSPPSSADDEPEPGAAPPGAKRKRKPERTVRVPHPAPAPPASPAPAEAPPVPPLPPPLENGDAPHVEPEAPERRPPSPRPARPPARRKTRSGSAETIDDIAAMIADTDNAPPPAPPAPPEPPAAVTVDKLHSVLASPDARAEPPPRAAAPPPRAATPPAADQPAREAPADSATEPESAAAPEEPPAPAAAPRRRSARASNSEAPNVPVESPSEAKPAEPEAGDARTAEPAAASFVEVENQLEKMFAGLEEEPPGAGAPAGQARKRRRSVPARAERRRARGAGDSRTGAADARLGAADARLGATDARLSKAARKKPRGARDSARDAYDSGSNASSGRSRGPYVQVVGPRASPLSVCVVNAGGGAEEEELGRRRGADEWRARRGLHASTLGLRYDASTPDASWRCAFCARGPHAMRLGDLFGPYALTTDCDEYRALDEATRQRYCADGGDEVWFHAACGVWAPGLVAAGARLWGLAPAVWGARAQRCAECAAPGAALACEQRACRARAHLPCAAAAAWRLREDELRAACPRH